MSEDFRSEINQMARGGSKLILVWTLTILVIVAVATLGYYYLIYPQVVAQRMEANRNSQQYVTTTQQVLQEKMTAYLDLENQITFLSGQAGNETLISGLQSQQKAILAEMRTLATTIDEDQIPRDVATFLAEHPQY